MYKSNRVNERIPMVKVPQDKEIDTNIKKSFQENIQGIDKEQTVNPIQLSSQNIQIVVGDNKNDYSGKISGTTYIEKYNKIVENVIIWLFFGNDTKVPVYKTSSDKNGKFFYM